MAGFGFDRIFMLTGIVENGRMFGLNHRISGFGTFLHERGAPWTHAVTLVSIVENVAYSD